jgi:hypothetical protein
MKALDRRRLITPVELLHLRAPGAPSCAGTQDVQRALGRRRPAAALPDVHAEVVVVLPSRDEGGARDARHHVEADHVGVERLRGRDVRHLQVHVPHDGARRHLADVARIAVKLAQHVVEVERQRVDPPAALGPRPVLARAIAVDLDPVALGVVQVERLAHQVVGRAGQRPAGAREPHQRQREVAPARQQYREVEEPGGARVRRGRVRRLVELDQLEPAGEPDDLVVETAGPAGIGHGQLDAAHPRRGG